MVYPAGTVIQNGAVVLAEAPGWGLELDDDVARRHIHTRMSRDYFGEPL